ncbi:putative bZIP transcription factor [Cladophialophora carrionii]|uniref:Putative bZIP transcription factor n=1 Tax=Cladophialophora carrionii TaxID=86049 RepID=A0A1C1CM52_9EURO|nr:putative bZIP transcription factor [Cladophialophora carrionii]
MTESEPRDLVPRPSISTSISSGGSSSSSDSDLPQHTSPRSSSRRTRMERPRLGDRQRSNTIIVPKGRDVVQTERPQYPPDDARAMSPRRNSEDIERLERGLRETLKEARQARNLQSSLAALAEKIDEVKTDHDKLETENRFLQDYIGGLTRTMSRDNLGRSASTSVKMKGRR